MAGPIVDKDNGAKSLMHRLGLTHRAAVDVGVLGEKAAASEGNGSTVGEVASIHEFGLGVDKRSFIRDYVDQNEAQVRALQKKALASIAAGNTSVDQAMEVLGLSIAAKIQERISNGIEPPNKKSTIARKGSSKPLIDTGQLRSSIVARTVKGGR